MRTKDEEIAVLGRWFSEAHAEPDSYLAGLMTHEFMTYVHTQIVADQTPDIHAELIEARQALLGRPSVTEINALRQQILDLNIEHDKLARDLASMSLNWQAERDWLNCEKTELADVIVVRDLEINRLKALLWDAHEAAQGED